jgi:hypothetical protein
MYFADLGQTLPPGAGDRSHLAEFSKKPIQQSIRKLFLRRSRKGFTEEMKSELEF